jgi:hypothetical protein
MLPFISACGTKQRPGRVVHFRQNGTLKPGTQIFIVAGQKMSDGTITAPPM